MIDYCLRWLTWRDMVACYVDVEYLRCQKLDENVIGQSIEAVEWLKD